MERRFLITTAKYSAWRFNEPVVFLGDWCKLYSQKHKWESLDSAVASYRWDDRKQLFDDYIYLDQVYQRILPIVAGELNRIHHCKHSIRFWRIIIGPWLLTFIQIIFERFHQVSILNKEFDITGTLISGGTLEEMVPQDMLEFADFFVSDEWNHHIYSSLIKEFSGIPYKKENVKENTRVTKHSPNYTESFLSKQIGNFLKIFHRKKDLVIVDFPLDRFNQLKLLFKYGCLIEKLPKKNLTGFHVENSMRSWNFDLPQANEFEKLLFKFIPLQIPILYLEGFKSMIDFCEQFKVSNKPSTILSSYITYNEEFKFWTAIKTEQGAHLNILQHGGGYGIGKWFSNEEHENTIADQFFSWGWSEDNFTKVLPLGMLKRNLFKQRSKYDQDHALLILGSIPRYSYKLYSEVVSKQWLNYYMDQTSFINSLSDDLRDKLKVKLYQTDYGWNDALRFKDEFPEVCFETGNTSLKELSVQSRVIISTYNSTSFLETFAANIPSIVYWDPTYWELRDSAIPYFQELRKVGVFHDSPVSAALHLNKVWDNVFEWWTSNETQEAVKMFVQKFCYTSPDMLNELMIKIKSANLPSENAVF